MVVVADETKLVSRLGERAPLPVEVIPFALPVAERLLRELGWEPELRVDDGRPFVTDEGNRILHCTRVEWVDPAALARDVSDVPGVVAHGFFLGFASAAVVGYARRRAGAGARPPSRRSMTATASSLSSIRT